MKIEVTLAKDGYTRLDAITQAIEDLAHDGMFAGKNAVQQFHRIVLETRKMRQTLRDVTLLAPAGGGGGAA